MADIGDDLRSTLFSAHGGIDAQLTQASALRAGARLVERLPHVPMLVATRRYAELDIQVFGVDDQTKLSNLAEVLRSVSDLRDFKVDETHNVHLSLVGDLHGTTCVRLVVVLDRRPTAADFAPLAQLGFELARDEENAGVTA